MAITQLHITPKNLRSDNGPEFMLHKLYTSKGITHHMSRVKNPQQNRMGERKHKHLLNLGRTILYKYKLSKTYWSFSLQFATAINTVPNLSFITSHLTKYFITNFLNLIPSKCLALYVMLLVFKLMEKKWILR